MPFLFDGIVVMTTENVQPAGSSTVDSKAFFRKRERALIPAALCLVLCLISFLYATLAPDVRDTDLDNSPSSPSTPGFRELPLDPTSEELQAFSQAFRPDTLNAHPDRWKNLAGLAGPSFLGLFLALLLVWRCRWRLHFCPNCEAKLSGFGDYCKDCGFGRKN